MEGAPVSLPSTSCQAPSHVAAVFVGLPGAGHFVAHPATARRVDRREQRRVPPLATARAAAEYLVGEIDHVTPPAGVELAAPTHVLRGRGGGDVERARRRRPPIQQHWFVLVVLVEKADPADVRMFAPERVSNRPKHSPFSATSSRFTSLASARTATSRSTGVPPFPRNAALYSPFTRARSASSRV